MSNVFIPTNPHDKILTDAERQKWESDLDNKFQSTRPMRGATRDSFNRQVRVGISIHAPHAGRDILAYNKSIKRGISIHAPHAGRDRRKSFARLRQRISIHAPHAGRD